MASPKEVARLVDGRGAVLDLRTLHGQRRQRRVTAGKQGAVEVLQAARVTTAHDKGRVRNDRKGIHGHARPPRPKGVHGGLVERCGEQRRVPLAPLGQELVLGAKVDHAIDAHLLLQPRLHRLKHAPLLRPMEKGHPECAIHGRNQDANEVELRPRDAWDPLHV
ncbi:hypothetical protein EBZ80_14755, partial [bacterium]|nr:hypothetical protein [bacterium]